MSKILITGGAGFIGANFIRMLLAQRPDFSITNFDALTYAGNLDNLADVADNPQYNFVRADITDAASVASAMKGIDYVIHFAAESHVDRSILDATAFIETNVVGTQILLDAARACSVKRFVHVSTDEVYGTAAHDEFFTEKTHLAPNSPYAASKASSDLLVRAANKTHDLDTVITRCSNNYGPYQFPEKLIPLFVSNAMEDKSLPVYGDGQQERDWIHVLDHNRAVLAVLENGKKGEVYNIGAGVPVANLDLIKALLSALGKPESLIEYVKDRLGHDRRYAIDSSKLENELGWKQQISLEEGLSNTIEWYKNNKKWWERIKSGAYCEYYKKQYGEKE